MYLVGKFAQWAHERRFWCLVIHFKTYKLDLRPTDPHLYLLPPHQVAQVESQAEEQRNQGGRYNLRRRKDDGETKATETEPTEAAAPVAPPAAASPSPSLDFGGKIGRFLWDGLVCERVCLETPLMSRPVFQEPTSGCFSCLPGCSLSSCRWTWVTPAWPMPLPHCRPSTPCGTLRRWAWSSSGWPSRRCSTSCPSGRSVSVDGR